MSLPQPECNTHIQPTVISAELSGSWNVLLKKLGLKLVFVIRKKLLAQPMFSWLHPMMCNSLLPIISYLTCCHDLFSLLILVLGELLVPCCVHVSMRALINGMGCFIIRNNVQLPFLSRSGDSSKSDICFWQCLPGQQSKRSLPSPPFNSVALS